ncbi:MAG: LPS assembly protein LptD [Bacterioplanes sp.]|nr:LPS assembly protein LptD [Bacterioplanes sp.]
MRHFLYHGLLSIGCLLYAVNTLAYYESSYLSWYPRAELSAEEQIGLPSFCHGNYRTPIIIPLSDERTEMSGQQAERDRAGTTTLEGDVVVLQGSQQIRSDYAQWSSTANRGVFRGNVQLINDGIVLHGQQATIAQDSGVVRIDDAAYSAPARHFRGTATHIQANNDGTALLDHATFTFCPPENNHWDLRASNLRLDRDRGIASAWHTRLRVKEVPILYLPYYRFPIGDQRMTGFLNPQITLNGKGQGEDIQLPFYVNIAPNLDATITPHHILDRGIIWEGQLRHKTALLGDGELNYARLNQDATTETERWYMNYQQSGRFGQHWQHRWVYNHVSDEDYLNDMKPTAAIDRTTHLPRRGEIFYRQQNWAFDVLAEGYQTIDPDIALRNRPYQRLPQLQLSYRPTRINDWQLQQTWQITRFTREQEARINGNEQQLSGLSAWNGERLVSDTSLSYPQRWPFGFVTPQLEYRHRSYRLNNDDVAFLATDNAADEVIDQGVARYSLDAGLFFDRPFQLFQQAYLQTLEPRVYWVKSPYLANQERIPNFDSARTTVTYGSLFIGDRFSGNDRLADLDQISVGVTTRFIRDDGLEQLRASIGRIQYHRDRRVQLHQSNTPNSDQTSVSSTLGEIELTPNNRWQAYGTLEWDSYQDYAKQRRYGVRYEGDNNRMFNLAFETLQQYNETTERFDVQTRQVDMGFFWALDERWAIVGRQLRDRNSYASGSRRPLSPVLESLAGVEYQNCCWRAQLVYRENSSPDTSTDAEFSTKKRYGFMLSIQLKGLGTFGSGTDALINDGINGYSRRQYHDY